MGISGDPAPLKENGMDIEDIVLSRDRRGISSLRPHLSQNFCYEAAALVSEDPGTAIIITGFYILDADSNETDGPPGAIVLGEALKKLEYKPIYVTDRYTLDLMRTLADKDDVVIDFPITGSSESENFAKNLLRKYCPSVVVATERCGATGEQRYRNMKGQDITEFTARTDYLFQHHPATIGVGDGGNELGMGNLALATPSVPTLVKDPCTTRSTAPVICSVANWGMYGIVAALSIQRGKNILPSIKEERNLVKRCVQMGAVDGASHKVEERVDGFTLEENSGVLAELHRLVESHLH